MGFPGGIFVTMDNELSWTQKLILKLRGRIYIEHRTKPGWKNPLPFYAFKCPKHGLVIDRPYGFKNRLECPECDYISKT